MVEFLRASFDRTWNDEVLVGTRALPNPCREALGTNCSPVSATRSDLFREVGLGLLFRAVFATQTDLAPRSTPVQKKPEQGDTGHDKRDDNSDDCVATQPG